MSNSSDIAGTDTPIIEHKPIALSVNHKQYRLSGENDPLHSLADVLREDLGLTGTKIGCRTGECGACTVLLDGKPVVSCLIPAASAEGHVVQTVEQLADTELYQSLIASMLETGGVQCGFCTPGIMVTLWAWLQDRTLFGGDIGSALKNNICRCTGYQSILSAVDKVIKEAEQHEHDVSQQIPE